MKRILTTLATALLTLWCGNVRAATYTWDGGAFFGGSDWDDIGWFSTDNWSGGIPANNGTADIHFGGSQKTSPNMQISYSIYALTFNSGAASFTLNNSVGTTLTVHSGGVTNNDDSLQTVNISSITLGASQTWNAGSVSGGSLVFGGATLDLGSSHTLTVMGNNNLTINNAIGGSGSGIIKNGTGSLILGGNNSFTGGVTINAGVVQLGNAGALNSTTPNAVAMTGGTLRLNGNNVTVSGLSGAAGTVEDNHSSAATLTVNKTSGSEVFSGSIQNGASGTLALSKSGGGTLVLNGNNAYGGATAISAGVLNIRHVNALGGTGNGTTVSSGAALEIEGGIITAAEGITLNGTGVANGGALRNVSGNNTNSGAITFSTAARINSDSGTLTLAGALSGNFKMTFGGAGNITVGGAISGSADVEYDGSGILTLNGNNGYTGATTVGAGGTAKLGHANALGTTGTGTTVNSGGVLDLNGQTIVGESLSLSGTGISSGGALINSSGTAASSSGGITLAANSSVGGSGHMTLSGNIGATANSLTKVGAGTTTLSGNNSFTGGVLINGGVLQLGSAGALNSGTPNTAAVNSGTLRLNGNSITVAGLTGAGTVENNHASTAATLTVNKASGSDTFSGVIQNGGAATLALNKTGAGTLELSGANTYTGGTTLTGGTLKLGVDNAVGSGGMVFAGGTLESNGRSFSIGALSLTANSTLELLNEGNGSLTFASATADLGTTLVINNWFGATEAEGGQQDRVFITANPGSTFLEQIQFTGFSPGAVWMSETHELLPNGLTPVPEPTEWALIIFAALAVLYKFVLPRLRPALAPATVSHSVRS